MSQTIGFRKYIDIVYTYFENKGHTDTVVFKSGGRVRGIGKNTYSTKLSFNPSSEICKLNKEQIERIKELKYI